MRLGSIDPMANIGTIVIWSVAKTTSETKYLIDFAVFILNPELNFVQGNQVANFSSLSIQSHF